MKQPLVKMMALFVAVAHIVQTQRRFNRVSSVFLLPGNSGTGSSPSGLAVTSSVPWSSAGDVIGPPAGDVSGSQAFYQVVHDRPGAERAAPGRAARSLRGTPVRGAVNG